MSNEFSGPGSSLAVLPEQINGPRVQLRRWKQVDVDVLAAVVAANIEHLRPWMDWIVQEPMSRRDRLDLIATWERGWSEGGDVVLGVFVNDAAVGGCGLHRRRGPTGLEMGYWVDKDHLSQGIATETAQLLTTAAFTVRGVDFVEIHHDKANVISGRIPQRLGYRFLGETPDEVTAPGQVGIDWGWRMNADDWN